MRFWFTRDAMFPGYVFWFGMQGDVYDGGAIDVEAPFDILATMRRHWSDTVH